MTEEKKTFRVLYSVTLAEWYEVEASSEDEAEDIAYCEGKQVDKRGKSCDRGDAMEVFAVEVNEVQGGAA